MRGSTDMFNYNFFIFRVLTYCCLKLGYDAPFSRQSNLNFLSFLQYGRTTKLDRKKDWSTKNVSKVGRADKDRDTSHIMLLTLKKTKNCTLRYTLIFPRPTLEHFLWITS